MMHRRADERQLLHDLVAVRQQRQPQQRQQQRRHERDEHRQRHDRHQLADEVLVARHRPREVELEGAGARVVGDLPRAGEQRDEERQRHRPPGQDHVRVGRRHRHARRRHAVELRHDPHRTAETSSGITVAMSSRIAHHCRADMRSVRARDHLPARRLVGVRAGVRAVAAIEDGAFFGASPSPASSPPLPIAAAAAHDAFASLTARTNALSSVSLRGARWRTCTPSSAATANKSSSGAHRRRARATSCALHNEQRPSRSTPQPALLQRRLPACPRRL